MQKKKKIKIIPIINKIDLINNKINEIKKQIKELINYCEKKIILTSGKKKIGINQIIKSIIQEIPHPEGNIKNRLQAMIFDSTYNPFKGIEVYFRIFNGCIKKGDNIKLISTEKKYEINEIGVIKIKKKTQDDIKAGNIGYLIIKIKKINEIKIGDTITNFEKPCKNQIEKIEERKPIIFTEIYPLEKSNYKNLESSIEKLRESFK